MKILFMKLFLIVSYFTLLMTSKTLAYDEIDPAAPLPTLKEARKHAKNLTDSAETFSNYLYWAFSIAFIIAIMVAIYLIYKYFKNRLD